MFGSLIDPQEYENFTFVFSFNCSKYPYSYIRRYKFRNVKKYRYLKPCADGTVLVSNELCLPYDQWVKLDTEEINL